MTNEKILREMKVQHKKLEDELQKLAERMSQINGELRKLDRAWDALTGREEDG